MEDWNKKIFDNYTSLSTGKQYAKKVIFLLWQIIKLTLIILGLMYLFKLI